MVFGCYWDDMQVANPNQFGPSALRETVQVILSSFFGLQSPWAWNHLAHRMVVGGQVWLIKNGT
jgi:hypothetical protein